MNQDEQKQRAQDFMTVYAQSINFILKLEDLMTSRLAFDKLRHFKSELSHDGHVLIVYFEKSTGEPIRAIMTSEPEQSVILEA